MRPASAGHGGPHLSARDVELLHHLAAGRSTAQIATAMEISGNTVRTRIHRVMAKLEVTGRREAVRAAETDGLLRPIDDREVTRPIGPGLPH